MQEAPPGRPCRVDGQMSCKVCGIVVGYDFHVPDVFWHAVVPQHLRDRVLCAGCFHAFALSGGCSRWEPDVEPQPL